MRYNFIFEKHPSVYFLISFFITAILFQILSLIFELIPSSLNVSISFAKAIVRENFLSAALITSLRTLLGLLIGGFFGIVVGILLGLNKNICKLFEFQIDFLRSIPAVAWLPAVIVIFGIGDISKIAISITSVFALVAFSTMQGVMQISRKRSAMIKLLPEFQAKDQCKIICFEILPQIFTGLRLALSISFVVSVVSEMFIGNTDGLGKIITDSQQVFDLPKMYAAILLSGLTGYLLNQGMKKISEYFVFWNK